MIVGGMLQHECSTSRSIGYFIEPLLILGLFGKKPLNITLRGVTNDELDPTVDTIRTVTLPLLKRLLGEDIEGLELKVVKRGARPLGGGEVILRVPVLRQLPPISLTDEGMIKRIRGVSYSMKVSPQNTNRMVDGARGVLNQLLADVFIFTDAVSGASSGLSPGYGLTLVAETTSGCLISSECCATSTSSSQSLKGVVNDSVYEEPILVPEDIGKMAAQMLLEEINRGGVVDGSHQALLLILAALGPEEVNQVRLGPLTPHAVRTLRTLRDFLGVTFSLKAETESRTIFLTCIGSAIKNMSKKVT
jgi:RNA 3'-terminal phosphate cyclase-like protein